MSDWMKPGLYGASITNIIIDETIGVVNIDISSNELETVMHLSGSSDYISKFLESVEKK